ncbi:T9SS type A sorting domain-containing protein [Hymenobacter cellulosilyticus]|uniref:T9SS type A sorting domain-containing protein n=1 Tax=Hymenobacter cellulosilyticus TaxID=2932248 RepID=A0A8T9Q0C7_9BACT|nr:T9SS type A sorting domain-containing protein [Hymenobacter cellulosilyticus]UOQ70817.1 T9SS type A sorting domain-containing protein [Hymenobacter cellulosilyticus]
MVREPYSYSYDEFITQPVTLQEGHTYQASFYALRRPGGQYAEKLALYVSQGSTQSYQALAPSYQYQLTSAPYATIVSTPIADHLNWTLVSGTFVAKANSSITIGFAREFASLDPSLYSVGNGDYFAVDDVQLTDLGCLSTAPATPGSISGYLDPHIGRIRVSVAAVPGATSYNWYLDGYQVDDSFANGNVHSRSLDILIPQDGSCHPDYTVSVEAVNGCAISAQRSKYYPAGTGGCSARTAAVVYPNPAADQLNLPTEAEQVTLLDNQGHAMTLKPRSRSGSLDIRTLPAGLYQLRYVLQGKAQSQRIQIKR